MRVLIIFFSLDGNTKFIAESMAREIGADLEELKANIYLPSGVFGKHFWGGRMAIFKKKPALRPIQKNISDYDLVVIGTPVWAFTFTPPIRTFFDEHKFSGKKIALFCCCDGMAGKTIGNMKEHLAGNEIIGSIVLERTSKNRERNKQIAVDWIKKLL